MGFPIPDKVQRLWDEWNLRCTVLISLFFQVILIFSATSRKRTGNTFIILVIWSAYLLADWVAAFAVGLISNGQGSKCDKVRVNEDLSAFWAPFLLLHLGGPDTITAFSLEDNELWLRHLLGLVIQLVAVAYVFSQSIPNEFWIPTVLLFFAGFIKYAERTRALYLACLGNFKDSMLPKPDAGPNYAQLMEEYSSKEAAQVPVEIEIVKEPEKISRASVNLEEEALANMPAQHISDIEVVQNAYRFYKIFKGLAVDLMFSFHERNDSRKFFFQRTAKDAFRVMEVELNFMYDALYTKMAAVHRKIGYAFRLTCSILVLVTFWYFALHHKRGIHRFDIGVTYTLLIGATGLDIVAIVKLIFSDWTIVSLKESKVRSIFCAIRERLSFDKRCRWSQSIAQHSLIKYCLRERFKWFENVVDFLGLKDFLDEMQYKKSKPVEENLKEFIFSELRGKALRAKDSKLAKDIYSSRGDLILSEYTCYHPSIVSSVSEEVEYDESLVLWHIATELCYFTSPDEDHPNRDFSMLLSEYMLYLLVMRPTLMSAVAGIGQIRYRDTCEEAQKFFLRGQSNAKPAVLLALEGIVKICSRRRSESMDKRRKVCEKLLSVNTVVKPAEVKGDRSKSVLFDACVLAKGLNKLSVNKRWEMMSKVWVELLSYAASHCRANAHAQQLSKGGELVTFVWLLMAHFGLGEQFRIEAGHARAKLIVGK